MQVAKLTSDDGEGDDNFGHSVAISDIIVVVGAYKHADSTHNQRCRCWCRVSLHEELFRRRELVDANGKIHKEHK